MVNAWGLFPFPTLESDAATSESVFQDGSLISTPSDCLSCPTRECLAKTGGQAGRLTECRFGMHYLRVDDNRIIVGVVATDLPSMGKRAKRRGKQHPELRVRVRAVEHAAAQAKLLGPGVVEDLEQLKEEVMTRVKEDPAMFNTLADQLRKDFAETLTQSHDFLQLVKLVRGHAETLLLEKFPDSSVEDAAEKLPTEGAIFFSTEMMLVKMDSLVFLNEINRVFGGETRFQIHPFTLKYYRIYKWQAAQKNLAIQLQGQCYGHCWYNSAAIGALLQGLLDNLVKYAPPGSKAVIDFQEQGMHIDICFISLGPRIDSDERGQIFLPGYRARAARASASEGLGVGLATAKNISDALNLNLTVEQSEDPDVKYAERYETTFRFRLKRMDQG